MKRTLSRNDDLIWQLIDDPQFRIFRDGTIETIRNTNGIGTCETWRQAWCMSSTNHRRKKLKQYSVVSYRGKLLPLHRVIYLKFIGPLDPTMTVNHIDGDTLNNSANNLELATHTDNRIHGIVATRDGGMTAAKAKKLWMESRREKELDEQD